MPATLTDAIFGAWTRAAERTGKRMEAAVGYALQPPSTPVGCSPKTVVWRKNKAKLYRYEATAPRKHAVPMLLIYALINKPYIMDLTPGNSLVEDMVSRGYDVYMLDWGIPGEEDAGMRLEDYILDYIPRAVQAVLATSGAKELSIVGYCMGGTLSTCYAALHPEAPIKNLVLMTTPIDFRNAGLFEHWLDAKGFNVDRVVETYPLVPPEFLNAGSKGLKPLQNYFGPMQTLADKLDDPKFVKQWQAMDKWVNDGLPFPGATYRQWIKLFYQENHLFNGTLTLGGRPVLLSNIRANLLNVYAELDHIVPICQATPILDLVSSPDKQSLPVKAGHVGVVAGRSAKQVFFPALDAWLAERSA